MDLAHMVAAGSIMVVLFGAGYSAMEGGEEVPRFQKDYVNTTSCPELELGLEKYDYRSAEISQLEGEKAAGTMIVNWSFEDARRLRVRTSIDSDQEKVKATNGLGQNTWTVENITVEPERCGNTSFSYSP